jgi:predicted RNase H-like HicB family nuclease
MKKDFPVIVERCTATGLFVGKVPGIPGAHSQGETMEELRAALTEVVAMLLEDGEPEKEAEFVGLETLSV